MSIYNGESTMPLLDYLTNQETKQRKKQKPLQQKQQQWGKNEKKRLLNKKLCILPVFTPLKPYRIIFINYMSPLFVILRLIERASTTIFFSIDTETDDTTKKPAIIQIEFVPSNEDDNEDETTIVILEMCQLPTVTSDIYLRVQKLVYTIFHPSKTFLSWDDEKKNLNKFTIYHLLESLPIQYLKFIDVQGPFKNWYNDTFKHDEKCYMASLNNVADSPYCTCDHRPYKQLNDKWSLQRAIAVTFNEFLDKSSTRSNWGQGLDIRLYQNITIGVMNYNVKSILTDEQEQNRLKLVKYAVDDCLAVTKLSFAIGKYLFEN